MMDDAQRQLHALQAMAVPAGLPVFDTARMRRECDLYLDWYLPKVAGMTPDETARAGFHDALAPILARIAALPRVAVHLDYHSRNLMRPPAGLPLGVIDFQDAVAGPVTYDLASLLYDCYQDYAEEARQGWSAAFFAGLPAGLRAAFADDAQRWHEAVRLSAFQRHLKAIGIFARLAHRDGKRQFLDEIPLTRRHLADEIAALGLPELPGLRSQARR
jgi:aminoglycoside/choline kinase family phosphotransferase